MVSALLYSDTGVEKRWEYDLTMMSRVGRKDRPVTGLVVVCVRWEVYRHSAGLCVCNARMADRVFRQGTHTMKR